MSDDEQRVQAGRASDDVPDTGRELLDDLTRPEQALARFYRALNGRDLRLLADNWEQFDEVVMDNPVGGISRGWHPIRAIYERLGHARRLPEGGIGGLSRRLARLHGCGVC